MKINGVRIKPRWPWSKEYRSHVLETLGTPRRSRDDYEKSAVKYARWIAERDGISLMSDDMGWGPEPANYTECRWNYIKTPGTTTWGHIKTVEFYRAQFRRYWSDEPTEKALIATIEIPNHDYEPSVAETTIAEPETAGSAALAFAA